LVPYNFGCIGRIINRNSLVAMNEKLEKEIDSYIAMHFSEAYDGTLLSDATKAELSITDVAPMARYFYNLALQEIRQETERLNILNKQIAEENNRNVSDWQKGLSAGYADIIRTIDSLTK